MKTRATCTLFLLSITVTLPAAAPAWAESSAKNDLPTVRVSGLHTLANWPTEQFPPRVSFSDIGPRQAFPADRACVEKQIEEIRKAAAAAGGARVDEIHITLNYGADPEKNVRAEVQTSYKYRGPSWMDLKFGEKRVLEVSTTLPNIRKNRDSDRCVTLPSQLVGKALANPGTNYGNLVVGVSAALDDLNRGSALQPASAKAVSDRRAGKPGEATRDAGAEPGASKAGSAR